LIHFYKRMPKSADYLAYAFQSLLEEKPSEDSTTDFKVQCKDDSLIHVHSFVLAVRSSVLKMTVNGSFKESETKIIEMKNYSPKAVNEFIRFLYGFDFSLIEPNFDDNVQLALELIEMGGVYNVKGVQTCVATFFEQYLNNWYFPLPRKLETLLNVLEFSMIHNAKDLEDRCTDYIAKNDAALEELVKNQKILEKFPSIAICFLKSNGAALKQLKERVSYSVATFNDDLYIKRWDSLNLTLQFRCSDDIDVIGFGMNLPPGSKFRLRIHSCLRYNPQNRIFDAGIENPGCNQIVPVYLKEPLMLYEDYDDNYKLDFLLEGEVSGLESVLDLLIQNESKSKKIKDGIFRSVDSEGVFKEEIRFFDINVEGNLIVPDLFFRSRRLYVL